MSDENYDGSTLGIKPRDFFRTCEQRAIAVRKLLKNLEINCLPGSIDGLVKIAELVEHTARRGYGLPALEAIELVEYVELWIDMLCTKLDALLDVESRRVL